MGDRADLQEELEAVLGSTHVYFQPPPTLNMVYPCIVYQLSKIDLKKANNKAYSVVRRYEVTVIDKNPDTTISENLLKYFEQISFDRRYTADNLNHDILVLFY